MTAPSLPLSEAMADFAEGPDLVLQCRCGAPMQPAEMRRLPTGPGNRALVRIGCPDCYGAAAALVARMTPCAIPEELQQP